MFLHLKPTNTMKKLPSCLLLSLISLSLLLVPPTAALPLSTNSRWIVDESGNRVKLSCVNWVSHLDLVVAEGLSKQPVDVISKKILEMGFNCVRLTWPLYLFTNDSLASITVRQSFMNLGLMESIPGFQVNNPSIIHLTLIQAYQAVVSSLESNKVMIILDNHISKPGWCCSNSDGNGFFGDPYFNPDLWLNGLTRVATMSKDFSYVVGMSLRNELRGLRQNITDWYRYMQKGAEVVHSLNPDLLVIVSGLDNDKDFSFLRNGPFKLSFTGKLVFEVHSYSFSNSEAWKTGNANEVCGRVVDNLMKRAGFLMDQDQGYPLFVSEFGVDQRGINFNDNRFLNCFLGWAAEHDLDWALWTLVGSYYYRQGVVGMEEFYGLLSWDWRETRNSTFLRKISSLQSPFQGPGLPERRPHKIIYHPSTGLCVQRKSQQAVFEPLQLGPCSDAEAWAYSPQNKLTVKGTYFCLQADEIGKPPKLGVICTDTTSKWEAISDSKMHLASKLTNGTTFCLDVDSDNGLVVGSCSCLSTNNICDPASQWFKIIDSKRSTSSMGSLLSISSILDTLGENLLG